MDRRTYLILFIGALASIHQTSAGWNPEQPPNWTVGYYCSDLSSSSRVCFTTDVDVSKPKAGSNFEGMLSADGKSFVIYAGRDEAALLLLDDFTIRTKFDVPGSDESQRCADGSVALSSGRLIDTTTFCNGTSYWLHVPAIPK